MLNGLDLFSGIGGLGLALDRWVRPISYCENDRYAQSVLLSRMATGDIGTAPIWDDVTSLNGAMLPSVDIIYGGFPCQDISIAGNGVGLEGKRSGLFFEMLRLIEEIKPTFVFLENVPAIRTRGAERVGKELARLGYDCRWDVVSAAEVGAPHLRKRWFLLGHAKGSHWGREIRDLEKKDEIQNGPEVLDEESTGQLADANYEPSILADSQGIKFESMRDASNAEIQRENRSPANSITDASWWETEPNVGRVAHGVSNRVDRLRGLGNAVVPLQARTAFERLMGLT